jgi:hypothetical protein
MTDFRARLLFLLRFTERRYVAARLRVSTSCIDKWAAGLNGPSRTNQALLCTAYPDLFASRGDGVDQNRRADSSAVRTG